ncbi:unnamed protein product [Ectocarpus sp. 12 AP-2014]
MENVICVAEAMERCGNDEQFMIEMVGIMRDDLLKCLNLLADAYNGLDTNKTIRDVSHRVKGQAANMAAKPLWDQSRKLETAPKANCVTRSDYIGLILRIK